VERKKKEGPDGNKYRNRPLCQGSFDFWGLADYSGMQFINPSKLGKLQIQDLSAWSNWK
jgi:hypothetical protein